VAKNEPATLNCKAEGDPTPVITWYRDGLPVTTANENPSSHRMLLPSGQLFFLRIINNKNSKPDVGTYYCNATSPRTGASAVSRNATLQIAGRRSHISRTCKIRHYYQGRRSPGLGVLTDPLKICRRGKSML